MAARRSRAAVRVPGAQASPAARKMAAVILEVLGGVRRPAEGAAALAVSVTRYYALEHQAVAALVGSCEPKARGPGQDAPRQIAKLTAKVAALERELRRHQALVRATRKAAGLSEPASVLPAKTGDPAKPRRRSRPKVRALRRATQLAGVDSSPATATLSPRPDAATIPVGAGGAGTRRGP